MHLSDRQRRYFILWLVLMLTLVAVLTIVNVIALYFTLAVLT
jgi:hypothetical protein